MPNCTCSASAKKLPATGSCVAVCAGCVFANDVTCEVADGSCHFTGTVTRKQCTSQPDETWDVDLTMSCGAGDRTMQYKCDAAGQCAGYEITFSCSSEE